MPFKTYFASTPTVSQGLIGEKV